MSQKKIYSGILALFLVLTLSGGFVSGACDAQIATINTPTAEQTIGGTDVLAEWSVDGGDHSTCIFNVEYKRAASPLWTSMGSTDAGALSFLWDTTGLTEANDYSFRISWINDVVPIQRLQTSGPFAIDNSAPTIDTVTGTTVENGGDTVQIVFDEAGGMNQASVEDRANWAVESPNGVSLDITNAVFNYNDITKTLTVTLDENSDSAWLKNGDDVCVTPTASVVDIAGNPIDTSEVCSGAITGDVNLPTVSGIDDTDFLFIDRGNTVTVFATFSEAMDRSVIPTVTETGADAPGWTLDNIAWVDTALLSFDYSIPDDDLGPLADTSFTISGAEDLAGNIMDNDIEPTIIDTDLPQGTVAVDTALITDSDLVQIVTVTYDEAMNPLSTPTINFAGMIGGANSRLDGIWSAGNTVWTETFDITDANEETVGVSVSSSGATDVAGNAEDIISIFDTFDIDTKNPIGTVSVGTPILFDSDLTQEVTVTYDEAMDPASTPILSFGATAGVISSNADGGWDITNMIWTETFDITDANEETVGVSVSSSGATDVAGNVEDMSVPATFDVDTLQPTVISATAMPDPAKDGLVTITVEFSEVMDVGVSPTVQISGLFSSPYSVTELSYTGTTWTGTFVLNDDDEAATATIEVSDGQDIAGNVMNFDNAWTFQVDTNSPVTLGPSVIPVPVVQNNPAKFMASVFDDTGVEGANVHVFNAGGSEVAGSPFAMSSGAFGGTSITVYYDASGATTNSWNPGVYSYFIEGVDAAGNWEGQNPGNTGTFFVEAAETAPYYQGLHTGWNTLFLPKPSGNGGLWEMMQGDPNPPHPTDGDLSPINVLDPSIGGNYSVVWYNVDGTMGGWKWYAPGNGASTLTTMNNVNANPYWINMIYGAVFRVMGIVP